MHDERGAKEPHPVFSRHRNGLAADDNLTMPFFRWPLTNLKDRCSFSHCRGFFGTMIRRGIDLLESSVFVVFIEPLCLKSGFQVALK